MGQKERTPSLETSLARMARVEVHHERKVKSLFQFGSDELVRALYHVNSMGSTTSHAPYSVVF